MDYGLTLFPTAYSIQPADAAKAAEERGFESIWFPEHTHIPVSRETPWPGGAPLPQEYYDTYDPFIALSMAAAATETIKIATGICLVVERDPIVLAKVVASLDQLSGGRFMLGVGGGWNVEEMRNHGTAFDKRWKVQRERIEAMKAIWTDEKAEYHGEFVDFDPIFSNPKPLQKPHPPIHVGGVAPWNLKRAIRYGNGWMPIHGLLKLEHIQDLRRLAEDAGRDPASIEVTVYGAPRKPALLAAYRDAGVHRVVYAVPPAPRDEVLPKMDAFVEAIGTIG